MEAAGDHKWEQTREAGDHRRISCLLYTSRMCIRDRSFTSAFMGLLFDHYKIPIVLVASNLPLSKPEGNGLANFAAAVSFIRNNAQGGVYVIYRDHKSCMKVYHALTICEADPVLDDYHDLSLIHI